MWLARARYGHRWGFTVAISGGLVAFAYTSAPWLFASYYVRYAALTAYVAALVAALRVRRRAVLPVPNRGTPLDVIVRTLALVAVIALNVLALVARVPPDGAVDMAFPLGHGTYSVLQGGNSVITNPFHRENAAERLALDLVKLNGYGARARGVAPQALDAYAVFDDSVFSPCRGTAVKAVDGISDNTVGRSNLEAPAGNHVIVSCAGVDLLLAHLREGSVAVRATEGVTRAHFLGRVGNSGNTSEPHLHISASREGLAVPLTFGGRFLSLNSTYSIERRPP